jgi:hypothetical protein
VPFHALLISLFPAVRVHNESVSCKRS